MSKYDEKLKLYRQLNDVCKSGGAVLLGTGRLGDLPLAEMARDYQVDLPVYNRSLPGLRLDEAAEMLEDCVVSLRPRKVFVALGEEDMKDVSLSSEELAEKYAWLLYTIHSRVPCRLYVVSLLGDDPRTAEVNRALQRMARGCGCEYVDVTRAYRQDRSTLRLFGILGSYMRERSMGFAEAMSMPM